MPLVHYNLDFVHKALRAAADDPERTGRVLCFSTPDLIVGPERLRRMLGAATFARLRWREDAADIIRWHKAQALTDRVPDTASLFEAWGSRMTALDVAAARGGEVIHDLCEPLPPGHRGCYDLVLDVCSNQVFDPAQALRNALAACRAGGHILHSLTLTAINQGFYSLSPALFHDFYAANGAEVVELVAVHGVYEEKGTIALEPVWRHRGVPDDVVTVVLVKKLHDVERVRNPIMTKFVNLPLCKPCESHVQPG